MPLSKAWLPLSLFLALGCTPPADTLPQSTDQKKAQVVWIDIPETQDRMLITVGTGPQREAVVDVPWTQKMRNKAVEDGFSRGRDAHVTRALYRFYCGELAISTHSYAVLSEQGETLTSRVFPKAKPQTAVPGTTAARYLVAGCENRLAPAQIKRLLGPKPAAP
jgi:hypothetical protein